MLNFIMTKIGQKVIYLIRNNGVFARSRTRLLKTFGSLKGKGNTVANCKSAERESVEDHYTQVARLEL